MDNRHYENTHTRPEQDAQGDGELPTYNDLTAQHAHEPNSRFGRWKSWIDKRAAERYIDVTPDEYARRRARGWDVPPEEDDSQPIVQPPTPNLTRTFSPPAPLRLHTDFDAPLSPPTDGSLPSHGADINPSYLPPDYAQTIEPPPSIGLPGEPIPPTHIRHHHFGSRFLPHAPAPIRCVLPLPVPGERLLLVGHDDGLSVLDMFPHEWAEDGLLTKGPEDAQARLIWEGEGVYQMSILEMQENGEGTPQGVVLVLVGSESGSPKDHESLRTIRMYSLASLISLAKWAVSQRDVRPLDLRRATVGNPQETPGKKKHRSHASFHGTIAKGLKSLILESPVIEKSPPPRAVSPSPTLTGHDTHAKRLRKPSGSGSPDHLRPPISRDTSSGSGASDSWDVVDDLPLRWATDYVALATPGSRLASLSAISFELRLHDEMRSRGGAMLAVATKPCILLYETPKGERAFKFVKEFYTPLCPKQLSFIYQSVPRHHASNERLRSMDMTHSRNMSSSSDSTLTGQEYSPQLSLFVIFDKKAGVIRLADSAVSEVELYHDDDASSVCSAIPTSGSSGSASWLSPTSTTGGHFGRRSRASFDGTGIFNREGKGFWLAPSRIDLPAPHVSVHPSVPATKGVYVLTRGRHTHVVPAPLRTPLASHAPLRAFIWRTAPSSVAVRIVHVPVEDGCIPHFQVVAFGSDGVEIQELPTAAVWGGAKGKGRADEVRYADADIGGDAKFLTYGGHWHHAAANRDPGVLARTMSVMSYASLDSFASVETEDLEAKLRADQGLYGWVHKGADDHRVVWLGGTGKEGPGAL